MDPAETFVPIAFFFIVIGLPIMVWFGNRLMAHQERMEMLRRGVMPPPGPPDSRAFRKAMQYGAWTPPPGAGMPPNAYPYYDPNFYAQHQLRRGIQVAFIGLALLIGLSFIGYHGGTYIYGPWLLGGLIPMFVGIAQIIGAVLSGARIPAIGVPSSYTSAPQGEPPRAGTTAGSAAPPPSGPYAGWRPGPTPEIEKPPSPPDYRG